MRSSPRPRTGRHPPAKSGTGATPANWVQGDNVIISPATSDDEARTLYPNGWTEHIHYLRTVADPVH